MSEARLSQNADRGKEAGGGQASNRQASNREPCDRDALLAYFTERQFLRPHERMGMSLRDGIERLGICPDAVDKCVARLGLDLERPIGRFKSTELKQLSASLERIARWQAQIQPSAT
jgi:hypothetical protein